MVHRQNKIYPWITTTKTSETFCIISENTRKFYMGTCRQNFKKLLWYLNQLLCNFDQSVQSPNSSASLMLWFLEDGRGLHSSQNMFSKISWKDLGWSVCPDKRDCEHLLDEIKLNSGETFCNESTLRSLRSREPQYQNRILVSYVKNEFS